MRNIFLAFNVLMTLGVFLELALLYVKHSPNGSLRFTIQSSQSMRVRFSPNQSIPNMTSKSYMLNTISVTSITHYNNATLPSLTLWVAIKSTWAEVDTIRVVSKGSNFKWASSTNPLEINECLKQKSNSIKPKWPKTSNVPVTIASGLLVLLVVVAWATACSYCCWALRPLWFCRAGRLAICYKVLSLATL